MCALEASAGYSRNGLPYNRLGDGPDVVVVFDGIGFDHAPMHGIEARLQLPTYAFLTSDYTVYVVKRRKGMPPGYTIRDMSEDYAEMIRQEFDGPVDVVGVSYGGLVAQVFAADHPELVRRLVLHSTVSRPPEGSARDHLIQARDSALKRDWRGVTATIMEVVYPPSWYKAGLVWMASRLSTLFGVPDDPSDFVAEVDAELGFDARGRLAGISAPSLLVANEGELPYSPQLFRETAGGIPGCKLVLCPGARHPATGRAFESAVLEFLRA